MAGCRVTKGGCWVLAARWRLRLVGFRRNRNVARQTIPSQIS